VKFIVWMHWRSLKKQLSKALATYEKWGAAGIKVDYMNREDQKMVNFYHKVAKAAAKHHLLIDFHGAYEPTGIRRTWPNVLTREAVMGLEYNKWSKRVTTKYEVTISFTRMLVGPMDFTPGGFDNATKSQFKVNYSNPEVMGTRAHQLAMYVIYLSPLQMVAGYPGAIAGKPGSGFIKNVPASWDETKYLQGKIGKYIVLARRKGKQWFIGAMTGGSARKLKLSLSFLPDGTSFKATVYADGENAAKKPTQISITHQKFNSNSQITIGLAPGGGWAARLSPVQVK
jgi:alpha-glucosidase